jgi:arginine:agmatine antiporter
LFVEAPGATTGLLRTATGAGIDARKSDTRLGVIEVIAFIFSVFTLYGCGAKAVLYGTIMLVLGTPVYVWQRRRAGQAIAKA